MDAPLRLASPGAARAFGQPRFVNPELADLAARDGHAAAWVAAFERHGIAATGEVHGPFAVALRDRTGRTFLAVDRFSICTLCFRVDGETLVFHDRADVVAGANAPMDPQAIFDYLYFHMIPAPRTIFRGVQRLPAGHYALYERGCLTVAPWWKPVFDEDCRRPFAELRDEFRQLLRDATTRQIESGTAGCFLSGGTDSSTVAGVMTEVTGKPAPTFSIGFDVAGYDEMKYARIAARHFHTDHHEYYVTPDDLVAGIPQVARSYDQPFGNSSVLPAYYCAKLAREAGVDRILGGDGGDELFGGNSRYAKQRIFGAYDHLPGIVRKGLLEPLLSPGNPVTRLPGVKKAASYVEQARVPMPDRMQMYNLLTRLGLPEVLTPEFMASIDTDEPLRGQREVYAATASNALINRMLAFDWRYTLADNDLPKVIGATALAGISVGFPLLDDALTDFSLQLEPRLKLRGLQLRWFFKEALRGFLPDEILAKKKHGFGLPFGTWANTHPALKSLALESIESLRQRGIVREAFLRDLIDVHLPQHPEYYGEMLWVLMMLEQWLVAESCRTASNHAPSEQVDGSSKD
jgi:asparagine synthase (glutamine-hydrolysing)